jgi:ribonucleoside-diphosphate reductase alpha chain
LPAGGSCLLGSINLAEFVNQDKTFNFDEFNKTIDVAVKSLNDILEEGLPLHPLQEQRDSVKDWRQIGLGIFGLADMLIKMGFDYGSEVSTSICGVIAKIMLNRALQQSALLAKEFGSYPKFNYFDVSTTEFYKTNVLKDTDELIRKHGLRNSQLLTIAPTGTLSTMLGVSGGIEPVFANYYERKTESLHDKDVFYKVYTPIVEKYMKENNITDDKKLPSYFITAQNLDYRNRIDMQSVWQSYIDASISSTVNVPNDFAVEQVEDLYLYAYEKGLKGVTIFRDGCKRLGILTVNNSDEKLEEIEHQYKLKRGDILEVNDDAIGKKRKLNTGCGSLHCTAFFDPIDGTLLETYLSKGSSGGCNNFMIGLSRMISLATRAGVDIDSIVDQLNSSGACPSYAVRQATKHDTSKGACCPMAVGNVIKEMWLEMQDELGIYEDIEIKPHKHKTTKEVNNPCPQCGAELIFSGGCNSCPACGWSKCS